VTYYEDKGRRGILEDRTLNMGSNVRFVSMLSIKALRVAPNGDSVC
jgi:hypothetical protein